MIEWWWRFHASLLRGGNDDKIFPFIHGEKGNEGKSAWTRLFEAVFGDYCSHVETNYFTETPKNADSATPVTSSLRGVRVVWVEEVDDTKAIKAGPFKKKTGKDRIQSRGLFQDAGTMIMQMTFIGVGNDLPPFSNAGLPVKERVVIVPFRAQRCDDAPGDELEQYKQKKFPRDDFFDQEIEYYGAVTLWLLVQYYGKYLKEKLRPYPAQIKKYTSRYWEEKDKYNRFLSEMMIVTDNVKDTVDVDEIYEIFKEWHENNYPKSRIPNNDELRKELRNRRGKMQGSKFIGMSVRTDRVERVGMDLAGNINRRDGLELTY
jgi:phage/plasmid-associated DNA primase